MNSKITKIIFWLAFSFASQTIFGQTMGTWNTVGYPGSATGKIGDMLVSNGIPYLSYGEAVRDFKGSVAYLNGELWTNAGDPGFSIGEASDMHLAKDGDQLYIAYNDDFDKDVFAYNHGDLFVKKIVSDGYNGLWTNVSSMPLNTSISGIAGFSAKNGQLTIGYGGDYLKYCSVPYTKKFNGTAWDPITNNFQVCDNGYGGSFRHLVQSDNSLYAVYDNYSFDPELFTGSKVVKQVGTEWIELGNINTLTGNQVNTIQEIIVQSGVVYASVYTNTHKSIKIVYFDGTNWQYLGDPNSLNINPIYDNLTGRMIYANGIHITYINETNHLVVKKFNGSIWQDVGSSPISTSTASSPLLASDGQNIFLAYQDDSQGGKITVKKFYDQSAIVKNGDFANGLTNWSYSSIKPSTASGSVVTGQFNSGITNDDGVFWHISLKQTGIFLENGKSYTLSFKAKSQNPREISAQIKDRMGLGIAWTTKSISSSLTTYSTTFTLTGATNSEYQLMFFLGSAGTNNVWLDDIQLTESATYYKLSTETINGTITLDPPGGTYLKGTIVNVTANPNPGYYLQNWIGPLDGFKNPETLTMNSDMTLGAFFAEQVVSNPVSILGSWVEGTTNPKKTGSNRALLVMVHAEHSGAISPAKVTYGGQTLSMALELSQATNRDSLGNSSGVNSYTGAYYLTESKINAAVSDKINVTWISNPSAGQAVTSVFLANVDQVSPLGISDGRGSESIATISTGLMGNRPGDMILFAGTSAFNGNYTVNNGYTKGIETANVTWGDCVAGHKLMTGNAYDFPSVTQTSAMRQSLVAMVVRYTSSLKKGANVTQTLPTDTQEYSLKVSSISKDQISFVLPDAGNYTMSIYNMAGAKVMENLRGVGSVGLNSIPTNQSLKGNQTYIVKIQHGQKMQVQKMMLHN